MNFKQYLSTAPEFRPGPPLFARYLGQVEVAFIMTIDTLRPSSAASLFCI